MQTFKAKIFGMKKKFRFLDQNETIQEGDLYIYGFPSERFKEYILTLKKLPVTESAAIGDLVSDHENRTYIRLT